MQLKKRAIQLQLLFKQKAIPVILSKKDVLAAAQTGTGKTAGFTLPLLELLNKNYLKDRKSAVKALILTPTRELATQVGKVLKFMENIFHLNQLLFLEELE